MLSKTEICTYFAFCDEFFWFLSTYFAKNSAGKIYQGLRKMLVSSPGP